MRVRRPTGAQDRPPLTPTLPGHGAGCRRCSRVPPGPGRRGRAQPGAAAQMARGADARWGEGCPAPHPHRCQRQAPGSGGPEHNPQPPAPRGPRRRRRHRAIGRPRLLPGPPAPPPGPGRREPARTRGREAGDRGARGPGPGRRGGGGGAAPQRCGVPALAGRGMLRVPSRSLPLPVSAFGGHIRKFHSGDVNPLSAGGSAAGRAGRVGRPGPCCPPPSALPRGCGRFLHGSLPSARPGPPPSGLPLSAAPLSPRAALGSPPLFSPSPCRPWVLSVCLSPHPSCLSLHLPTFSSDLLGLSSCLSLCVSVSRCVFFSHLCPLAIYSMPLQTPSITALFPPPFPFASPCLSVSDCETDQSVRTRGWKSPNPFSAFPSCSRPPSPQPATSHLWETGRPYVLP